MLEKASEEAAEMLKMQKKKQKRLFVTYVKCELKNMQM